MLVLRTELAIANSKHKFCEKANHPATVGNRLVDRESPKGIDTANPAPVVMSASGAKPTFGSAPIALEFDLLCEP